MQANGHNKHSLKKNKIGRLFQAQVSVKNNTWLNKNEIQCNQKDISEKTSFF